MFNPNYRNITVVLLVLFVLSVMVSCAQAAPLPPPTPTTLEITSTTAVLPAFPGAQGHGAVSVGGRGGQVILVTNLDDEGPGSLRACVEAQGPRTCVFRVAGTIELTRRINVTNSYLTIAGQTAPGGGITVKNADDNQDAMFVFAIGSGVHDVIVRYLHLRIGSCCDPGLGQTNLVIYDGHNIIIDHVSSSWTLKDGMGIWWRPGNSDDVYNVTFSRNLIAEGLWSHSTGLLIGGDDDDWRNVYDVDVHHNLFVHNSHRNPRVTAAGAQVINNVVYNWLDRVGTTTKGAVADIINNYWLAGPMSKIDRLWRHQSFDPAFADIPYPDPSLYVSGNVSGDRDANVVLDHYNGTPILVPWKRSEPLPPASIPIAIQSAQDAYESVMADIGATARLDCEGNWVPAVDGVDARLLQDVINGTGYAELPPHNVEEAGGYPAIDPGTPCVDTDDDGMPDDFERLNGFNPNDPGDGNEDADGDGYSNLEEYLNGH